MTIHGKALLMFIFKFNNFPDIRFCISRNNKFSVFEKYIKTLKKSSLKLVIVNSNSYYIN